MVGRYKVCEVSCANVITVVYQKSQNVLKQDPKTHKRLKSTFQNQTKQERMRIFKFCFEKEDFLWLKAFFLTFSVFLDFFPERRESTLFQVCCCCLVWYWSRIVLFVAQRLDFNWFPIFVCYWSRIVLFFAQTHYVVYSPAVPLSLKPAKTTVQNWLCIYSLCTIPEIVYFEIKCKFKIQNRGDQFCLSAVFGTPCDNTALRRIIILLSPQLKFLEEFHKAKHKLFWAKKKIISEGIQFEPHHNSRAALGRVANSDKLHTKAALPFT